MKKLLALIIVPVMLLTGCSGGESVDNKKDNTEKLQVAVTINPLKEFAEQIGGDKVNVVSIIPDGVEPHDFDPKPRDLESLSNASVFVYNGLDMEDWIDSVISTINEEKTSIVNSSENSTVIETEGKVDPHIWLSLKEADNQSKNILNALVEADPDNKDYYTKNYEEFSKKLNDLDKEYQEKFKGVNNKDFVTGHAAFGYLCREFGLEQKSLQDVYGEGELTAKNLEALVNYCKENKVKVIFSESSASSAESETLAKEVGVTVEKIYSLEAKEDDMSYLDGMKFNLEKIYNSLK